MFKSRFLTLSLAVSFLFIAAAPSLTAKKDEQPAGFFPPHTYCYIEVNPHSAYKGVQGLKLANILKDPGLNRMFLQALADIPSDVDPRKFITKYDLDKALGDCIAFGAPGIVLRKKGNVGEPPRVIRFPGDEKLNRNSRFASPITIDSLIAIKVADKDLFKKAFFRMLKDFVFDGKQPIPEKVRVDGIDLDKWKMPKSKEMFTVFSEDFFLMGEYADTVVNAIVRQESSTASLDTRADFHKFRKHIDGKPTAAIIHISAHDLIELFSPLLSPADLEFMRIWGGLDYSGLQFGVGFQDGGVCEMINVAFAENPHGIFMNLGRLWPYAQLIEKQTSRGLLYGASLTFDFAALYNVVMFTLDLCDVDTSQFVKDIKSCCGLDPRDEIFGALGNTMGGIVVMPNHGFIPETAIVLSVRNREKMEKVLSMVEDICREQKLAVKQFSIPGIGRKASYIDFGNEIPVKPAYVLRGDNLVISTLPLTLKYAAMNSRSTGKAIVDLLPTGVEHYENPMLSYFFDPAPIAMNIYADMLKLIDSGKVKIGINAADLPTPEFIASTLARMGVELSMDPYNMSLDIHSPFGIVLPTVAGILGFQIAEEPKSKPMPMRKKVLTKSAPEISDT